MVAIIDLNGPDGNAYSLMATARLWARQMEWSEDAIDDLLERMKSGDYENLLRVFYDAFPYVEFIRAGDYNRDDV